MNYIVVGMTISKIQISGLSKSTHHQQLKIIKEVPSSKQIPVYHRMTAQRIGSKLFQILEVLPSLGFMALQR